VRVSLERSTDFQMIAGPSAKACICGGRTIKVLFKIVPKKLGNSDYLKRFTVSSLLT